MEITRTKVRARGGEGRKGEVWFGVRSVSRSARSASRSIRCRCLPPERSRRRLPAACPGCRAAEDSDQGGGESGVAAEALVIDERKMLAFPDLVARGAGHEALARRDRAGRHLPDRPWHRTAAH